ncbi:MAG: serine/threonine-protein kinase [Phycisphaerales bacterium]
MIDSTGEPTIGESATGEPATGVPSSGTPAPDVVASILAELRDLEDWEQWALLERRCSPHSPVYQRVVDELGLVGPAPASAPAERVIAAIDQPRGLRPSTEQLASRLADESTSGRARDSASGSAGGTAGGPAGGTASNSASSAAARPNPTDTIVGDEGPTDHVAAPVPAHAPDPSAGLPRTVGGFRLLEILGRGASGVVFRAEQTAPLRTVALKQLRPTTDPDQRRRFAREADTLARLDHPGIARILESGVLPPSDAGHGAGGAHPYLVMELVPGPMLTRAAFADPGTDPPAGPWPPSRARSIIDCLAQVAAAVHHAHLNGVIHRDLKAANVRLGTDGRPRVLDFGVAKLLAADDATAHADETLSHDGQLVGTLRSMSPEQIGSSRAGRDRRVDARTDIHAIGLLLYELLTGRLPYELDGQPLLEAVRRIEGAPRTPLGAAAMGLPPELDVVLATAVARDPDDRYASCAALASDLRAVLEHRPIGARPPGRIRRAHLLLRRAPAASALVAAAAIGLLSATGLSLHFALDARANERDAVRQASISRRTSGHLESLLTMLDGHAPAADHVSRAAISDDAAAAVLDQFRRELDASADWPEVQAGVRSALGRVLLSRGRLHEARQQLRQAADAQRAFGVDGPPLAATLIALANATSPSGDLREAEALLREAIDVANVGRRDGRWPDEPGRSGGAPTDGRLALAGVLAGQQRWAEAGPIADALLHESESAGDPARRPMVYAAALRQRARIATGLGDVAAAEALLDRVIETIGPLVPPAHPMLLSTWLDRSAAQAAAGDQASALESSAHAADLAMEHLEPASFDWMVAVNAHVRQLLSAGQHAAALDRLSASHALVAEAHGTDHRVAKEITRLIERTRASAPTTTPTATPTPTP